MTLCVVWRSSGASISMATDSRVSFGNASADVSPKLSSLRVRLSSATPPNGVAPVSHDFRIGLSVVGSATSTLLTKELLQPILETLQYTSIVSANISLHSIANVIGIVFQHVSRAICSAIFQDGLGELLLVGRCPSTREARAFRVGIEVQPTTIRYEVFELLLGCDMEFFGSGKSAAASLHSTNPSWEGFKIVHEISAKAIVPSVGGSVQFGVLRGGDFAVKGIRDYQVNDSHREYSTQYYIGGMEVYGDSDLLAGAEFITAISFADIFATEIQQLDADGYLFVASTEHW